MFHSCADIGIVVEKEKAEITTNDINMVILISVSYTKGLYKEGMQLLYVSQLYYKLPYSGLFPRYIRGFRGLTDIYIYRMR